MGTLKLSLPEETRAFVEQQIAENRYEDAEAYVEALIQADRKRRAREHLEELLLEGLDSGPATPMTGQDWADLRESVRGSVDGCGGAVEEPVGKPGS
jgi:antitoxin ParD1/3/4